MPKRAGKWDTLSSPTKVLFVLMRLLTGMSRALQSEPLRVLQEKEVLRVGGNRVIKCP